MRIGTLALWGKTDGTGQLSRQCRDNRFIGKALGELDHAPKSLLRVAPAILGRQLPRQRRDNLAPVLGTLAGEHDFMNTLADAALSGSSDWARYPRTAPKEKKQGRSF
jgi:hypothetical protein